MGPNEKPTREDIEEAIRIFNQFASPEASLEYSEEQFRKALEVWNAVKDEEEEVE